MQLSRHNHRVLVLGAGGRVGSMLARMWQAQAPTAFTPIFQTSGRCGNDHVQWSIGQDNSRLPTAEAVVVLWGVTPGGPQPLQENASLALAGLDVAREVGAKRVLLASSMAVYTGSKARTHFENDPISPPKSAYGRAKLEMERVVSERVGKLAGPKVTLLRMANMVGADSLFGSLRSGKAVTLDRFASGKGPVRSYLTIEDFARSIEALLACPVDGLPDIVNVAGARALAMEDLVAAAGAHILWRLAPENALERVELDTGRLQKYTGPLVQSSDPELAVASWSKARQIV